MPNSKEFVWKAGVGTLKFILWLVAIVVGIPLFSLGMMYLTGYAPLPPM